MMNDFTDDSPTKSGGSVDDSDGNSNEGKACLMERGRITSSTRCIPGISTDTLYVSFSENESTSVWIVSNVSQIWGQPQLKELVSLPPILPIPTFPFPFPMGDASLYIQKDVSSHRSSGNQGHHSRGPQQQRNVGPAWSGWLLHWASYGSLQVFQDLG
jgi:hypothetical protein